MLTPHTPHQLPTHACWALGVGIIREGLPGDPPHPARNPRSRAREPRHKSPGGMDRWTAGREDTARGTQAAPRPRGTIHTREDRVWLALLHADRQLDQELQVDGAHQGNKNTKRGRRRMARFQTPSQRVGLRQTERQMGGRQISRGGRKAGRGHSAH